MKTKIITGILLTGILATGAFVYADSTTTGSVSKGVFGMMKNFRNSTHENIMDKLLNGESLTDAEKVTVKEIKAHREVMKTNQASLKGMMKFGFKGNSGLKGYLSTTLTTDQQAQLNTLETNFQTQSKALMTTLMGSGSNMTHPTQDQIASLKTQFTTLWTSYMQSVRPFIASDKLTQFDAMVAKGPQHGLMMGGKGGAHPGRGMMKGGFGGGMMGR